jgi:type IV fimbrial biogenesis protein FimT
MIKPNGFTLVEVMVTLVIAATLLFSIPSFVGIIKNNRQTTQANSLFFALTAARDESIKRNGPVSVCQSDDGADCSNTGWQDGWIVFVDDNAGGTVDGADIVLQVFEAIDADSELDSDDFPAFITYLSDGTSNSAGNFAMCDDRGAAHAVTVCIAATGRPSVSYEACVGGGDIECPDA